MLATLAVPTTASLTLHRRDISFRNVSENSVAIEIAIRNDGSQRSAPTTASLAAAPLGAFVDWKPLQELPVPAIAPGCGTVLRTVATAPGGARSEVAPALRTGDDLVDRRWLTGGDRVLPADPMRLLGGGSAQHWAGNLNVFVGDRDVERHLAQALRVYPGVTNLAMFIIGQPDEYALFIEGEGARWEARLHYADLSRIRPGRGRPKRGGGIDAGRWIRVHGCQPLLLALEPPKSCDAAVAEVHVRQRSTGREAVVEFSLDPDAAGPGCFTV